MKEEMYEAPCATVIGFGDDDIIRTSGDLGEWDEKSRSNGPKTNPNS